MALCNRLCLLKNVGITNLSFSTSASVYGSWRKKQGLEKSPKSYGPLNCLPDYSFVDGRPVPLSARKLAKMKFQEDLCRKIVEMTHEIDVGLEMYNERKKQEQIEKENIIKNKLKPKGAALLKHKKSSPS